MTWWTIRAKYLFRERDERVGDRDLPLLSVSALRGVVPRSELTADEPRADDLSRYKVCEKDDLVINRMSAYQGALGVASQAGIVSPDYTVLKPLSIEPGYAHHLVRSTWFVGEMTARLRGIGGSDQGNVRTPRINTEDFGQIRVSLPPRLEQREIAGFLDDETARIDALIDKKRHLATKLAERLAVQVEAELRAVASDCGEIPLRHLADVTVGIVVTPASYYADAGVPALRGVNILPGRVSVDDLVYITADGHALHPKSQLRAGDVVTVRTGQAGATAVVPPEFDGANCIDLLITRPGSALSPQFLELVINSDWCTKHIEQHAVGAIQGHFNVAALKNLPIPRADLAMQAVLVARTSAKREQVERLLAALRVQVERLREHRQALITTAVTGELDVTKAVA